LSVSLYGQTYIRPENGSFNAMREKYLDPQSDRITRIDFVGRVSLAFGDMARKGKVETIGRGRAMPWKLRD